MIVKLFKMISIFWWRYHNYRPR